MSIFKKIGNVAKGGVSSVGKMISKGTAYADKNGKQITGGLMVVGGAVATATGLGSAVGVPLMAAGVGVATAKSKADAKGALVNGAVSAVSNPEVTGKLGSFAASKLGGLENSKLVTSIAGSSTLKAISGSTLFKMNPNQLTSLSKMSDGLSGVKLPAGIANQIIGSGGKLSGQNSAVTVADAAQVNGIINGLPDATASQQTQIEQSQKPKTMQTVLDFAKKNWIIIAVVAVAVAAYFLFFRKKRAGKRF